MLQTVSLPFWNRAEHRPRAWVRILLQLALLALIGFGPEYAVMKVRQASSAHPSALFSHGSAFVISAFAMVLTVAIAGRLFDRRGLEGFGLSFRRSALVDLAFGTALGGVLMLGIACLEASLGVARYREAFIYRASLLPIATLPTAIVLFVAVSVREELLFRGYQLTNLAEGFSSRWLPGASAPILAALLSSFVFGLAHAGNPHASVLSTINIVVAGLMLAIPYLLTGDLGLAMGLHFGWNFFQNVLDMPVSGQTWFDYGAMVQRRTFGPDWLTGGSFGPEAGVTGLVAMLVGTTMILLWLRRRGPLRVHPRFGRWRANE
ncbi:MAG: lysostaphin resistance A-like protein [Sandaracinaceae bacterium]